MNAQLTAISGRDDSLLLRDAGGTFSITNRGKYILDRMRIIAALLDEAGDGGMYQKAVDHEYMALNDKELLPSSWIAREMRKYNETHEEFGLRKASENRYYFCMDEFTAAGSFMTENNHNAELSRFTAS
jgi:gamma-glutamylcysteine synthetase